MAALAVRAEVIAGRASAPVEHRMAADAWTAPHTRPASFRDISDQAVGFADRARQDGGAGGRCNSEGQCGAQYDRFHHVAALSRVEAKPNSLRVRNRQGDEATSRLGKSNGSGAAMSACADPQAQRRAINATSEYATRNAAASRLRARAPRPAGDAAWRRRAGRGSDLSAARHAYASRPAAR